MSYSETFHSSVTVSGTVSVHYPASEHGGTTTASYSETVPVDWTVYVDTAPFDASVVEAESAVDSLTGSIVSLNEAEVESIRQSSRKVRDSLASGFFNLIWKDLSENLISQINRIKTKFELLLQFSKDLEAKQQRMTEDVARLQRHYYTVFHSLDEDLEHRISALDQPAFRLGHGQRQQLLLEPYTKATAFGISQMIEGNRPENMMVRARTNRSVSRVLGAIGSYVSENEAYRRKISGTVFDKRTEEATREYVPVIVCVRADMQEQGKSSISCIASRLGDQKKVTERVLSHMKTLGASAWSDIDGERLDIIDRYFRSYVEKSSAEDGGQHDERVYQQMLKMWNENKAKTKEVR